MLYNTPLFMFNFLLMCFKEFQFQILVLNQLPKILINTNPYCAFKIRNPVHQFLCFFFLNVPLPWYCFPHLFNSVILTLRCTDLPVYLLENWTKKSSFPLSAKPPQIFSKFSQHLKILVLIYVFVLQNLDISSIVMDPRSPYPLA